MSLLSRGCSNGGGGGEAAGGGETGDGGDGGSGVGLSPCPAWGGEMGRGL